MPRAFLFIILIILNWKVGAQNFDAPSDIPRFQSFISGCKLQAPTSVTSATSQELNNGYTSDQFYVVEDDKIAFNQSGASMRTELRHETNWLLSEGDRSLHGRLKFVQQTCDQVTVVQIHDDANAGSGPNKPLLRIYKHLTKSQGNHLWAAIKTNEGGENTQHVDLGSAPSGYFDWDVVLENGALIINIDGVEKANEDVSFWTSPSYWKAGVYLQDDGEATVYFDELYEGGQADVILSVERDIFTGVDIYPNPTSSIVTIEFDTNNFIGGSISLYTVAGKVQQKSSIEGRKMELKMVDKQGLYFVKVQKGDQSKTYKVINKPD